MRWRNAVDARRYSRSTPPPSGLPFWQKRLRLGIFCTGLDWKSLRKKRFCCYAMFDKKEEGRRMVSCPPMTRTQKPHQKRAKKSQIRILYIQIGTASLGGEDSFRLNSKTPTYATSQQLYPTTHTQGTAKNYSPKSRNDTTNGTTIKSSRFPRHTPIKELTGGSLPLQQQYSTPHGIPCTPIQTHGSLGERCKDCFTRLPLMLHRGCVVSTTSYADPR